jgi:hypothetical protein
VAGIVFAVPEGWAIDGIGPEYVNLKNPDSEFELTVSVMTEDTIAQMQGEDSKLSLQEYFDNKTWYNGTIAPEAFDGNEGAYFNAYESANRELMAKIRDQRAAAAAAAAQPAPAQPAAPAQ